MLRIKPSTKVYVLCPANHQTGGTELAHQLVDRLILKKIDAFIVYVYNGNFVKADVPDGFKKYNIVVSILPDDNINNVLVFPEVSISYIDKFKNIQFLFWWMSVDNFYNFAPVIDIISFKGFFDLLSVFKIMYTRFLTNQSIMGGIGIKDLKSVCNHNLHAYQSAYAQKFLYEKNLGDVLPLGDYINSSFIEENSGIHDKQDIILYNPAKGLGFTKKIIKALPKFKFIALEKMSREELANHLKLAKLYIDFGNHPGKDRLPREAAVNNCCVIVGKKGSSVFFEDISIPSDYKFDKIDLSKIVNKIQFVMENYEDCKNDFIYYRSRIFTEKERFYKDIDDIFNMKT